LRASIIRTLAAVALLAMPVAALAAPDQNTNGNQNQNGCYNGQWINGQCVSNNNGNGTWNNGRNNGQNNGQWNNRNRHRDRDDRNDRDDQRNNNRNGNNGYNNGYGNNGYGNNGYGNNGYGNNGYGNNGYGNRSGQLNGTVSSFSAYNLYLSNGTHVELHNGTVINPTGTNLTAGQRVRVIGTWNNDRTFNANEIDVVGSNRNRGY
jgi:hypothetical protein